MSELEELELAYLVTVFLSYNFLCHLCLWCKYCETGSNVEHKLEWHHASFGRSCTCSRLTVNTLIDRGRIAEVVIEHCSVTDKIKAQGKFKSDSALKQNL